MNYLLLKKKMYPVVLNVSKLYYLEEKYHYLKQRIIDNGFVLWSEIPNHHVALVNAAIESNNEQCIKWIKTPFYFLPGFCRICKYQIMFEKENPVETGPDFCEYEYECPCKKIFTSVYYSHDIVSWSDARHGIIKTKSAKNE